MKMLKWFTRGVVAMVCLLIIVATALIIANITGERSLGKVMISGLGEMEEKRIRGAVDEILKFNQPDNAENIYDGAEMREDSYEENEAGGIYQAIFVIDLPKIRQSYRVNYYYLTESQMQYFEYDTLASCLPVSELIYGDFDCRGDRMTVFIDEWHEIAAGLTVEYGIPWEAVVAQGILESAAGTSKFAVERNNFFGIAAFDSNPDMAYYYDTPEEGWKGYFENIVHTPTYCLTGVFSGDNITDPYAYLRTIKAAGYATDPDYVKSTSEVLDSVVARAEKKGWASSAELAETYPQMLVNAGAYSAGCR